MSELNVAAYKEAVFGTAQSPTQTQQQDQLTASAENATENTVINNETENAVEQSTPNIQITEQVPVTVDPKEYLKENLGYESWEDAKNEIEQLRQLKANTQPPLEFVNEESRQVFELIQAGKMKDVKAVYDLQEKLETVENLSAAEKIKLHIEQTNKHFKKADVEDVFEERYTIPEKPEQEDMEEDTDYEARVSKWQQSVDKINRKIERDSITATEELSKLKKEIKLPQIQSAPNPELEELNTYKNNIAKADEEHKKLVDSVSKISEKDISIQLNFNDEAKKVKFDISFQADKDGAEKAKLAASDFMGFLSQSYFKEDGSPLADKLTMDVYKLQNFDKILTEAVNQAVNETMLQIVSNQKNMGDRIQRNFIVTPPSEIQRLKEQLGFTTSGN